MAITRLDPAQADRLKRLSVTYVEVGATASELPEGYRHLRVATVVGRGRDRFNACSARLCSWTVHAEAGLRVQVAQTTVTAGGVAVLGLHLGLLTIKAPCSVVYVVDDERRKGFAYGTLPGHPESGEESFMLEFTEDGTVVFTITAFSRAASPIARAGGPLTRAVQAHITKRYHAAMAMDP